MLRAGVDSALLAVVNESGGDRVFETAPSMHPLRRVARHGLRTLYGWRDRIQLKPNPPCGVFTSDRSFRGSELVADLRQPDIIHMHWVAEMFDEARFLPAATRIAPVIWTMRDMRPITGGCHYDLGCGKFREGCGDCPQLAHPDPRDVSRQIWQRRSKTLAGIADSRLIFVSPSNWLAREFQESPLCNRFQVHVIPNGVDTEIFQPAPRAEKKSMLGLDPDALVILFNAASLDNQIKGGRLLQSALKQLEREIDSEQANTKRKLQLLVVGAGEIKHETSIGTIALGHVSENDQLAAAYQAADLFVIPSLQDNCPNTVLESFACGLPVVGFDTSGIPDLVTPGETGLLATPFESSDLAKQIVTIIADDQLRKKMSLRCRESAVQNYSREVEAKRYLQLYQQILGSQC